MELRVDFNRVDKLGRVPARIPPGQAGNFWPGAEVRASDGEGTSCLAIVNDVEASESLVLLTLEPGTFSYDEDEPERKSATSDA